MAVGKEMVKAEVGMEEKEKWLMHYSSFRQILLVGEGDFSFSVFGSVIFFGFQHSCYFSQPIWSLSFPFLVFICIGLNSFVVFYSLLL